MDRRWGASSTLTFNPWNPLKVKELNFNSSSNSIERAQPDPISKANLTRSVNTDVTPREEDDVPSNPPIKKKKEIEEQ